MNQANQNEKEILKSFEKDHTWEDRYRRIIDWGKKLTPLEEHLKEDKLLVKGCQSRVWILAREKQGKVYFKGDSDALITKGLLALMIFYYSELSANEILENSPFFIKKLNLTNHLTPTRVGGLKSLVKQMQNYAQVFKLLKS